MSDGKSFIGCYRKRYRRAKKIWKINRAHDTIKENDRKGIVIMGMFGEKKTKEEKQLDQMEKFMDRYGLESIPPEDLQIIKRIANDLAGNNFLKAGIALSFPKAEEQAKVTYLSALVEQNWVILNQLSRLNTNIEKLINK